MSEARIAMRAAGLLREFNAAGVLAPADVHVARRLAELAGETDEAVMLAAALAVRGPRLGHASRSSASLNAVTSAPGGRHANTPQRAPSTTGVSGPVIPRTNR